MTTRRHKLPGDLADFAFRLPQAHLDLLKDLAAENGWSAGEAIRRALVLFFRDNMDITDSRYSVIDAPNGHGHE